MQMPNQNIFTPCIAFRVVGTPIKYVTSKCFVALLLCLYLVLRLVWFRSRFWDRFLCFFFFSSLLTKKFLLCVCFCCLFSGYELLSLHTRGVWLIYFISFFAFTAFMQMCFLRLFMFYLLLYFCRSITSQSFFIDNLFGSSDARCCLVNDLLFSVYNGMPLQKKVFSLDFYTLFIVKLSFFAEIKIYHFYCYVFYDQNTLQKV